MRMNRMQWVRSILAAVLAGWAAHSLAQALEIIPLRHRTVDQVLEVIEAGASRIGTSATAEILDEWKQRLTPPVEAQTPTQ